MLGIAFPGGGIDAVGRDDQVGAGDLFQSRDLVSELDANAQGTRPRLQQHQQGPPGAAAEAVATDAVHGALMADFDILPIGELTRDRVETRPVVALERFQRLVAEHDAEAERVIGPCCARRR